MDNNKSKQNFSDVVMAILLLLVTITMFVLHFRTDMLRDELTAVKAELAQLKQQIDSETKVNDAVSEVSGNVKLVNIPSIGIDKYGTDEDIDDSKKQIVNIYNYYSYTNNDNRRTIHVKGNVTLDTYPNEGSKTTLAYINKNPLNVKSPGNGEKWKGQIGVDKHGHAVFSSFEYGIRAGAIVLQGYAVKYKINTIANVVRRFSESNHGAYINYLCGKLEVKPNEKLNLIERMPELLKYMIKFESGQEFSKSAFAPYDLTHTYVRQSDKS